MGDVERSDDLDDAAKRSANEHQAQQKGQVIVAGEDVEDAHPDELPDGSQPRALFHLEGFLSFENKIFGRTRPGDLGERAMARRRVLEYLAAKRGAAHL